MKSFKQFVLESNHTYTRHELERMSWDDLCKMAFGIKRDDILTLAPSKLKIKWKDDLVNPEHKFEKGGMDWVRSVDFTAPVDISLGPNGKTLYLEDGHHRWFAAKKLHKKLQCKVEKVEAKAIEFILNRQSKGEPILQKVY